MCKIATIFGALLLTGCATPLPALPRPHIHVAADLNPVRHPEVLVPLPRPAVRVTEWPVTDPKPWPAIETNPSPEANEVRLSETTSQPHPPEGPNMQTYIDPLKAFFQDLTWSSIILIAIVLYYVYNHGWPWVIQKAQSIWGTAKTDFDQVVTVLKADIGGLQARIANLEAATGVKPPPPATKP